MERADLKEEKEMRVTYDEGMEVIKKHGLPQGLPWSPILTILVMDTFFKKENLDPVLYADDGILLTNEVKDIERIIKSPLLRRMGIILSEKLKKDGSASSKLIVDNELDFVGSHLNFNSMTISSPRGSCSLNCTVSEISKVV